MKKGVLAVLSLVLSITMLAGCGGKNSGAENGSDAPKANFKVGMVTDAGTIDDKSFNQGTYEGIEKANKDFNMDYKYLKPAGTTEADYSKEIGNLYDAGFKFIVTPGFKFETAVFKAQDKYKDAKFVIIDGTPNAGDGAEPVVKENSVAIFFAEHEAGFLAGVASALHMKEGQAGFIGGMEIPPVQKFNWGFQQGVAYANENLGTKVEMKAENVVYQGSFDDVAAGGQLAAQMYDRGVKVIFAAAGGVGVGAINEAKTRVKAGNDVWVVGVDVDQYEDGVYADGKSAVLTSAVKKIDHAAYDMIKAESEGKFPGGQTLMFDAKNDGIGLPEENPNLSEDTIKQVDEVFAKIKAGDIKVAAEQGGLIK
ncbi:BMP family lipoprotein [Paenibacillus sp. 1001270B_150601_E10]|uniref:BMP family lipoprotein n=1 Tax=Paenibacillus sp. 1001270B_150601_E10 TaxID=2787079 RepID=UPI0018A074EF|nr:BMP family protein [Paenibacillus sp. 1001270B_150601_E10]